MADVRWETPALAGELAAQVAQVTPLITRDTVVVGHDMGGVVAAMAALAAPPRAVVLTGTALGPWWALVRASAWPLLWRPFYRRAEALAEFPGADPLAMRAIARSMRPPPGLAARLAAVAPVFLLWGRHDRWYPALVGAGVARGTGATVVTVPGGHLAPWEEPRAYASALAEVLCSLD